MDRKAAIISGIFAGLVAIFIGTAAMAGGVALYSPPSILPSGATGTDLTLSSTLYVTGETKVAMSSGNFYIGSGSMFWNPGGTVQTVLSGGIVTHSATWGATDFKATAANGADGLLFTNEAEIQWPDTKIAEVGTALAITSAEVQMGTTGVQGVFRSMTPDATATSTVCGHVMAPNVAFTQGDCLQSMSNSTGSTFMRTYEGDGASVTNGTGSALGHIQGTLNVNTTAVGNLGASGPDDLQTYTLPASTLITTGRCIKIVAYGTQANNTNAKTVRLTIGPTPTVLITKQLQQTAVGAGDTWKMEAIVCRTGSSTQDFVAEATNYGGTTVSVVDGPTVVNEDAVGTLTQTETNALAIKVQSTVSTTDNDITSELLMVEAL